MSKAMSDRYKVTNAPFPIWDGDKLVGGTDWLGNEFRIGDTVMYAVSAGRGQMMAYGVVTDMKMGDGHPFHQRTDLVHVAVHTVKTSGQWNNGARTKPAWVNPINITAIPKALIEGSLKQLEHLAEVGWQMLP